MKDLAGEIVERGQGSSRVPPHLYFVGSAIFHYLGPSFAVLLFARVAPAGVAWLRITAAAVVFAVWRQPWRALCDVTTDTRRTILALGAVFAAMNYSFYFAIERLPLGTVAAIEFLGPIILAMIGTRSRRNAVALLVAVVGVYTLAELRISVEPIGFIWAFANAALFALYIVLAHRSAMIDPDTNPIDRLAAAMIVAAVVITPLGLLDAAPAFTDGAALGAGIVVGITSSVVPYVFDQLAMLRLPRATYALFVALLPATAVIIGLVVLGQHPSGIEVAGVGLVISGIAIHQDAQ